MNYDDLVVLVDQALIAENEWQRGELSAKEAVKHRDRLLDAIASLQRDAMRYRWLRARVDGWSSEYEKSIVRVSQGYDYASTPEELDRQIDEAMQKEQT